MSTAPTTEQPLDIPSQYQDRIENALVRNLRMAVDSVSERDELFVKWDMQLRGDPFWAGIKPRWRGGCDIEDPLTREHHLGIVANIMSVLRQEEWWALSAKSPGGEQDASALEAWINDIVPDRKLNSEIGYQFAYNAGRHSYAMIYCGWRQTYQTSYNTKYVDSESGETVEPEDRQLDRKYKQAVEIVDEVDKEGFEFRVPHAADFGTWPPTAKSVQTATFCWERMTMTADDLLDAVEDEGYDEEAVEKLLSMNPDGSQRTERVRDLDEADGIDAAGDEYEVYLIIGRAPLLMEDGESLLKPDQRRRDYLWMVCLEAGVCLKFAPSPFKKRPWVKIPFLDEPDRWVGDGVCSLIGPLQREATLATRFRVDVRDVAMSPVLLVPETDYDMLQRFSAYPGAMFPYSKQGGGPGSIVPLQFDKSGFGAALTDAQDFRMRAAQMFSAQARGSLTPDAEGASKTRMQAAGESAAADEKFDLVLLNLSIGITELGELILSHYRQFGMHLVNGDPQLAGNKAITLTPEMFEANFSISASGTAQGANPVVRRQTAMDLYQLVLSNPIVQMKAQQGDLTAIWEVSCKVARLLNVRDPRSIFGEEPQPPPNADQILQTVMAAVQQYAMAGDQAALRIMQLIQQMQQAMPQPMGGGQSPGGQQGQPGGPKMSLSVNYKDLASNDQAGVMQMMGLPAPGNGNGAGPQRQIAAAH